MDSFVSNYMLNIVGMLTLALILMSLIFIPNINVPQERKMRWLCYLTAAILILDTVANNIQRNDDWTVLATVINAFNSSLCVTVITMFMWLLYVFSELKNKIYKYLVIGLVVMSAITEILVFVGAANGDLFHIENGYYVNGDLMQFYYVIPGLCTLLCMVMTLQSDALARFEKGAFLSVVLFFVFSALGQYFFADSSLAYSGIVLSILAIYIGIFVRRSKQVAELEAELSKKRMSVVISQMQPHFLFNSLTSIVDLCDRDPQLAKRSIVDFSDYLRGNLDAMTSEGLVPFKKELGHCQTYLKFEKLRFEDALDIVYDIQYTEFSLPALSVQPLLENAVKHGIGHKEGGGVVMLSVARKNGYIVIKVMDNGVGFDTEAPLNTDRSHVGIENVRSRIEMMCGGSLHLSSRLGEGTTAEIRLPEEYEA